MLSHALRLFVAIWIFGAFPYASNAVDLQSLIDHDALLDDGTSLTLFGDKRLIVGILSVPNQPKVSIELLRGPILSRPFIPEYNLDGYAMREIDVRFLDADGRSLIISVAGHAPQDRQWIVDALSDDTNISSLRRFQDLERCRDLITILTNTWPKILETEEGQILSLINSGLTEDLLNVRNVPLDANPPLGLGTTYRHKFHRYEDTAYWCPYWCIPIPWANHTAVKVNIYRDNGSLWGIRTADNHGRAYNGENMRFVCYENFRGRLNAEPMLWGCDSNTEYGYFDGLHTCNDDFDAEYLNIKNNSISSWAFCGDNETKANPHYGCD